MKDGRRKSKPFLPWWVKLIWLIAAASLWQQDKPRQGGGRPRG